VEGVVTAKAAGARDPDAPAAPTPVQQRPMRGCALANWLALRGVSAGRPSGGSVEWLGPGAPMDRKVAERNACGMRLWDAAIKNTVTETRVSNFEP